MHRGYYGTNITYIGCYGFLGTLLNFIFNSLLISLYTLIGGKSFSGKENLIFAAALVASDAMAGLSMIDKEKFPNLHSIIVGEAMMNNAIAILLFYSVENIDVESSGFM